MGWVGLGSFRLDYGGLGWGGFGFDCIALLTVVGNAAANTSTSSIISIIQVPGSKQICFLRYEDNPREPDTVRNSIFNAIGPPITSQ